MASETGICNLALANLGDTAIVSSISPPDGSAQAQHCARFYPIARNALLEMATWGFATKRTILTLLENDSAQWLYAYGVPAGTLNLIAVIPVDATDDYSAELGGHVQCVLGHAFNDRTADYYVPQPYALETRTDGQQVIRTNVENAVLRHTVLITDTTKFTPLFVVALGWLLSSMLAGPLLKGEAGAGESKRCLGMFQAFEAQAEASDANQTKTNVRQVVPWIAGR